MGTGVLFVLAILAFGGAAMKVRVRRTSWHTVQAQHRALATMGKLAAEHAKADRVPKEPAPSRSAVRVVRGEESEHGPTTPPVLRSRPRRPSPTATIDGKDAERRDPSTARAPITNALPSTQFLPGPSVKLVREQALEPLSSAGSHIPAIPRPVLPTIPAKWPMGCSDPILRFDALADPGQGKAGDNPASIKPQRESRIQMDLGGALDRFSSSGVAAVRVGKALLTGLMSLSVRLRSALISRSRATFVEVARRPRAATGAAAALLVFVAIVGIAIAGTGGGAVHHPPAIGWRPAVHPSPASPPVEQGAGAEQAPEAPASLLEMTSSTSAVYQVTGPISVVLHATALCWIQARRSGPNGGLLFQGTLVAGQAWTVAGPTWLRLGNPTAVSLSVNGEPVSPPAAQGIPFDLQIG